MRKVKLSAFLVILSLFLTFWVTTAGEISVFAVEEEGIRVMAITPSVVSQGETGTCYAYIGSLEQLSSLMVTVYFDPDIVRVEKSDVSNSAPSLLYDCAVNDGSVQFSYIFDGTGNAALTQLFVFEYSILPDAAIGDTYFDVVVSEAYDSSLTPITVSGSRCEITVQAAINAEPHVYTRMVISESYQKSHATCTEPAVYYYCCENCDKAGTASYEYGSPLGHIGGEATCTFSAVCMRCSHPYGDVLDHIYADEDAESAYLKTLATCTDKAVYYKNCSMCGQAGEDMFEYGEALGHTGGTATCIAQAQCEMCGMAYGDVREHTYTDEEADSAYMKTAATCTDKAVYYKNCSMCGQAGEDTFEYGEALGHTGGTVTCTSQAQCEMCGAVYGTVLEHVYVNEVAEEKYFVAAATCTSGAEYYKSCDCGAIGTDKFVFGETIEHSFENDCDVDCQVCGYIRTVNHSYSAEWSKNSEKHWHECSVCGGKTDETSHLPGPDSTETTGQTCTVCGYVIKEALGHTHRYENVKNDDTNHWNECICGDKSGISAHSWDGGTVTKEATYEAEGEVKFTCSVCASEKYQSVDKLVITSPDMAGEKTNAVKSTLVVVGIVFVLTILTVLIIKSKGYKGRKD